MAGSIKGITIEFRGETTKLEKALKKVNDETRKIDREMKQVDKALKFNPTSVELWRQKQQLLTKKISETRDKLDILKKKQKEMDAKGVDKNSEEYRKLQREIIETESKLKHFEGELRKVGNAKLQALGQQFQQIGEKAKQAGKNLTMYVTTPLVGVGTVGAKKFAEVDKVMQLANKTMGNSKEQADLLSKAMKDAAANSTYGMNDAANASLNFARAGLTAEQSASLLAPAMNLAAGEGGDLDAVSAGLVATINSFGKDFENASTYVDVFANACNNSALDVDTLSSAMSVAAPIFATAGYKVNDAALYMGIMANKGIEADKAANSLKTGIARLIDPTEKASDWMTELGISMTDADGNMKDTVTVQKELHDAFASLSESEQIAAASAIFGKNQMAPWLSLINTAPEDVEALNESLMTTGTTNEMAETMMGGFGGSLEKLKSSLDVAATSLGEALAPMILKVANLIQKAVDWFNQLSPRMQTVVATIGTIVAAIGPLLVVGGTLMSGIGKVLTNFGNIVNVGTKIVRVIGLVATAIGPVGIAFVAVSAAIIAAAIYIYKHWDKIKAKAIEIKNKITQAFTQIKTNTVKQINAMKNSITAKWNALKATAGSAFNAIKEKIVSPIKNAVDKVKSIIGKVKGFFPISVGKLLSGLKLPHFSISGEFSIKNRTVPHLNVDWYKTGGIFDSPSIIGVGEAGSEAVVPLDKFWKKLDDLNGSTNIVININGANKDSKEIAEEVKRMLIKETNRQRLAWQ